MRAALWSLCLLTVFCLSPVAFSEDVRPDPGLDAHPVGLPHAEQPAVPENGLVVTINEAVAALGALTVALITLAGVLKRVWVVGKQLRAVIGGVEEAGDPTTKAAIAEKAKAAGVAPQLAARVEKETTRLEKKEGDQ